MRKHLVPGVAGRGPARCATCVHGLPPRWPMARPALLRGGIMTGPTLEEVLASADIPPAPTNMMDVAIGWADRGYQIFPCSPFDKKPLTPRDRDPKTGELIP